MFPTKSLFPGEVTGIRRKCDGKITDPMAAGILFPGEQKAAEHPEGGGQRNARLQLLPRHPFIPFDRLGEFGQIPLHLPLQMGENMPG